MRGGLLIGGLSALDSLDFPDGFYGCSVGSILATAVAFRVPLPEIRQMFEEDFRFSTFLPALRLQHLQDFPKKKGVFPMDSLKDTLAASFRKHGIELDGKVVGDAPQPLRILACNLTTRRATWLTGNVPLLEALVCSCAIPGIFQPRILYDQVYVDGAMFGPIYKWVPPTCLVFNLDTPIRPVYPADLADLSVYDYYLSMQSGYHRGPNVVTIRNNTVHFLQEVTSHDIEQMYTDGSLAVARFFAKRLPQEIQ
jgi:hypothetical protein